MQNRFGLKDFVMLMLIVVVGVFSLLEMRQADRKWNELFKFKADIQSIKDQSGLIQGGVEETRFDLEEQISEQSEQIAAQSRQIKELMARLESGQFAVIAGDGTGASGSTASEPRELQLLEDWTRPAIEVTYPEMLGFASDPTELDEFRRGGELVELFEAQWPKITPYTYSP